MKKKYYTLLIVFLLFITSCRKCSLYECTLYKTITLNFIGYTIPEADTVMIYKYQQDSNYTILADSVMAMATAYNGDTTTYEFIDRRADSLYKLKTEYDIEIVNSFDTKRIRISDIEREHNAVESCHGWLSNNHQLIDCENKLLSYNYSINIGSILTTENIIFVPK